MPFVERNQEHEITGLYNLPQPGRAEEYLADDHPEVIAFWDTPFPLHAVRLTADKEEILADGVDVVTLTLETIPENADVEFAYIMVNGPPVVQEPVVDGRVEVELCTTEPGFHKVEIAAGGKSAFIIIVAREVN